ncbi:MAG: alpha/beta fold hydrolase [Gammaproteobacteria bacterium]
MIHQSPLNGRAFERGIPLLAQAGLRVVAVDTPGYGNSDGPTKVPTIEAYANIYPQVLSGLGESSAHFLGHHTGARIICSIASQYPELIRSPIFNGPVLLDDEEAKKYDALHFGTEALHKDGSHLIQTWKKREHFTPGWTDTVAMHRRVVDMLWAGDHEWFGHYAAIKYPMLDDFMKLTSRAMIFINTGDMAYPMALKAKALRPDMDYAELEGGTHDIVDEKPEDWSKVILDFIFGH